MKSFGGIRFLIFLATLSVVLGITQVAVHHNWTGNGNPGSDGTNWGVCVALTAWILCSFPPIPGINVLSRCTLLHSSFTRSHHLQNKEEL